MRLIDADELKKVNEENAIKYNDYYTDDMIVGMKVVCEYATKDAPTVDAVPVIRCKDCKHYDFWGESMICMRLGSYYGNTKPNDYCSRAERKEE